MKRVAPSAGFTIVEAMVVLAVTGVLFLATALTWGGKQRASEYQTALRDTRSIIQQTISDVQNGYFPRSVNFRCSAVGASLQFATTAPTGDTQGTNSECVFLGKALQFGIEDGGTDIEFVRKYSVAGLTSGSILGPGVNTAAPTLAPYLTEKPALKADLHTTRIRDIADGTEYNGLAFLSDMGSYDSDGTLQSGRQAVRVYGLKGSLSAGPLLADGATNGKLLNSSTLKITPITQGVRICLKSGATENYALLTVALSGTISDIKTQTVKTDCSL